jgi:hypothetical protein
MAKNMKLKFTKLDKTTWHLLLPGALLLVIGIVIGSFAVSPVRAALSFNDLKTQAVAGAQSYCASLISTPSTYKSCVTEYLSGASARYNATSAKKVRQLTQAACSPSLTTTYPAAVFPTQCATFKAGVAKADSLLGNSYQGASNNGSNQAQNPSPPPPISKCDQANGASNQTKCKKEYRACNNLSGPRIGPAVIQCKKDAINKYVNPAPAHSPAPAHTPSPSTTPCNYKSGCDLIANYVNPAINLLSAMFGLIAVISLIMGGIQYSASEGDPQKASQAKSRLYNTLIAIFAYLFLYAILQFLIPGGLFK